jgi:hypothetical protein
MNTPGQTFSRYPQHLDAIRWLPWVAKVISGDGIDIIVLENENRSLTATSDDMNEYLNKPRLTLWWKSLRSALEKKGIDISQVGFMIDGDTVVRRLWVSDVDFECVWVWKIGIPALRILWVNIADDVGDIIPVNLLEESSPETLLMNLEYLRRLRISPADIVIWAKFEITTRNSRYHLEVNQQGVFELRKIIDGALDSKVSLFRWFGGWSILLWFAGQYTTPVTSMRKI